MSKKLIAILTIVTILFVCIFASCEKNDEDNIYINNKEYDFVTDENGERVLDDEGRFLVYSKDENGKDITNESGERVTEARPFEALENDGVVEDYGYKLTLPEGWKSTEKAGKFENVSTEQQAQISIIKKVFEEHRDGGFYFYEQVKESGADATWEKDLDLGQGFKNLCRLIVTAEDHMAIVYIFENSGNSYQINFNTPKTENAIKDSEAFCKNIEFKPYQYYEGLTAATTENKD